LDLDFSGYQLSLFEPTETKKLTSTIDALKSRFGTNIIQFGREFS